MESLKINPYIVVMIGVISLSTSAIFVKLSSADAGVIAFYRMFFTFILMLPFAVRPQYWQELKSIHIRDWLYSLIAGICLAFHFILWFESLNYTSVASSTVLVTLQPLFAFIGTAIFFKEKFTFQSIVCGMAAILGSIIISWGDFRISGSALYGDLLAFLACGLITAYFLLGQGIRKRLSLITYTSVVYFISSIVLFLYTIFLNLPLNPYSKLDWTYFLLMAVIPTLLGHSLLNWAIRWLSTSTISMAILFEPVGAAILAYFILFEKIVLTQLVGGMIIIISVLLFLVDEKKQQRTAL